MTHVSSWIFEERQNFGLLWRFQSILTTKIIFLHQPLCFSILSILKEISLGPSSHLSGVDDFVVVLLTSLHAKFLSRQKLAPQVSPARTIKAFAREEHSEKNKRVQRKTGEWQSHANVDSRCDFWFSVSRLSMRDSFSFQQLSTIKKSSWCQSNTSW